MWRPKGWSHSQLLTQAREKSKTNFNHDISFEAGADALLEELRRLGNSRGGRDENRKGTWIFIDDENL